MSYESHVFRELRLPSQELVMRTLLVDILSNDGVTREFGSGNKEFCDKVADDLKLTAEQRTFQMQTTVRKEDRIKKFPAWHRMLYRAAARAARKGLLSHPSDTIKLTSKREWMLTEKGINETLKFLKVPLVQKESLLVKTFEVEREKARIENARRVENYNPIDEVKTRRRTTKESLIRTRGFRKAVVEAYKYSCAVCGLRLQSPDQMTWEIEAAHIVPHRYRGKDDVWNSLALCRLHHWAFDAGWFTLSLNLTLEVSPQLAILPVDQGTISRVDVLKNVIRNDMSISLPSKRDMYPHANAILWHRDNIFFRESQSTKTER